MTSGPSYHTSRRTLLKAAAGGAAAIAVGSPQIGGVAALAQDDPVEIRWESRSQVTEFEAIEAAIRDIFEPANPNIKVNIEQAPDQERDERLLTSMVAGTAQDLFESWSDNVTQFADRGQVLDVQPLVDRDFTEADINDFVAWQWRDFVLPSGLRFGIPKYINVMLVWANVDMFEAAGQELPTAEWTHDDYSAAASALSSVSGEPTDVYGLRYPVWSWDRYWYKVESFGGQVVNPDDNTECLLGSPEAQAAMEWAYNLMWEERALLDPLSIGALTDPAIEQWAAQRFAMHEDGLGAPQRVLDAVDGAFQYQYFEVPLGPAGRRALGTTDAYVIYSGSEQPDAAWELAKFLSGPEFQEIQTKATGRLPGRQSVLDKYVDLVLEAIPEFESVNLQSAVNAAQGDYAGTRALFAQDAAARQIIEPALESIFVSNSNDVSYLAEIAAEVTEDQRDRAS